MARINCDVLTVKVLVQVFAGPNYGEGFPLSLVVLFLCRCDRERLVYVCDSSVSGTTCERVVAKPTGLASTMG